jgi:hypothetical protein
MARRLPASMRTREELTSLIEERLSTASAKDELVRFRFFERVTGMARSVTVASSS